MNQTKVTSIAASANLVFALLSSSALLSPAQAAVSIDDNDIGGQVVGANGPEAGVWVIAETHDLDTRYIKIVVTDDQGQYVIPELPDAEYDVFVRGYGLVDSERIKASPGQTLNLKSVQAPDRATAAEYYPANYWYALIEPPAPSEFPGTGPEGNGISPRMPTVQHWLASQKECMQCHQLGTYATRALPDTGNSVEAWSQRISKERAEGDVVLGNTGPSMASRMNNFMTSFGRDRALKMYANWTDRIRNGALPTEDPPRPQGLERNVVLTIQDYGEGNFSHDIVSTDKRNPTVNANGPVYGITQWRGLVMKFNPNSREQAVIEVPGIFPDRAHQEGSEVHHLAMGDDGRVWFANLSSETGGSSPVCKDPNNKYAKYFPGTPGHIMQMYDPETNELGTFPVCFLTHHAGFNYDEDDTVYYSGGIGSFGWVNTRIFDETKDMDQAQGWCPAVLDTNGDGKITPDMKSWNQLGGFQALALDKLDPSKDSQITSFTYGMNVSPSDGSIWYSKFIPDVPTGLFRFVPGRNPPETCQTEYYEVPQKPDGTYVTYGGRGPDVDSNGVVWVGHSSGSVASFDRRKCEVINGPTATGQHCSEGWTFHDVPGPMISGGDGNTSADMAYLTWIDLHNTFGLGNDIPVIPMTNSDSLLTYLPDDKEFIRLRVPYPMGYFARGVDGRIDDPKTGWKGRGLWSTFATVAVFHQEDGEGDTTKAVHFQLRPDPLAH